MFILIFPGRPYHSCLFCPALAYVAKPFDISMPVFFRTYGCSGWVTKASTLRPGGRGFAPRPTHSKDFKNGISCSFAWRSAMRKWDWSARCQYHVTRWYVSMCLGCDTSARQYSNWQHWASCRLMTERLLSKIKSARWIKLILYRTCTFLEAYFKNQVNDNLTLR